MEDVLEVYARAYDPQRPVVCVDEASRQLLSTPHGSLPMTPKVPQGAPGQPEREDYQYERHGTANLFLAVEPLAGRRSVRVTERRTSVDFAHELKQIVDVDYVEAELVVLVTDNLNTHSSACLYEAFEPQEARRIAQKIEWHYTPEHGSWLNMAEIELSVLSRQCLSRRCPDRETLNREVALWQAERNGAESTINWQFTCADARVKLRRLYPPLK